MLTFSNRDPIITLTNATVKRLLCLLLTFVSVYKSNGGVLVFFINFVNLCNKNGISPSAAAEEMGYQRSVVTRWSKGTEPRQATLQRVADYFGVSVEELTKEAQKEKPTLQTESELDPVTRELFDIVNSSDEDELKALLEMARLIKKRRDA